MEQRIQEVQRKDDWGDHLSLISMVHTFDISAHVYQADSNEQVCKYPAMDSLAR